MRLPEFTKLKTIFAYGFLALTTLFIFGCPPFSSDDPNPVLNIQIDQSNDSLLTCDTLIIKVYNKDSSFVQEVFHGKLSDAKKLTGIELDPRVGKEFKVSIVGYKAGKINVNKEITVLGPDKSDTKNLPIKDIVTIPATTPELTFPTDTTILEGDSLRLQVLVTNPWAGSPVFELSGAPIGAAIDANGILTWKPSGGQGKPEPYAFLITYSSADKKIEKGISILVRSINLPPELTFPTDTTILEGDSLRIQVLVANPWVTSPSFGLTGAPSGAAIDANGLLTWKPNLDQGRSEPYAFLITYSSTDKKIEKGISILVRNLNRPPKITVIPDQKGKVNETLIFKVEATDLDHDSITLSASSLPTGSTFSNGTFTWKPAEGQNGNYSPKFKAFDGRDSDLTAVLLTIGDVDVPPPLTLKIVSPSKDTTVNVVSIKITYLVNSISIQRTVVLKEIKTRIFIDTTVLGRTAFDTVTITLDTVPPVKPKVSGTTPISLLTPTWHWGSGGGGNGTYRYKLDLDDMATATLLKDTSIVWPKDLDVGSHTLFVQERDDAGNWSLSGNSKVRIDTTRPAAPTVTLVHTTPSNITQPTWNWTAVGTDLSGNFRYRLDNPDLNSGTSSTKALTFTPAKVDELKEGIHTLYVQQQDSAGNWSSNGSASIRIDLTPPGKPTLSLGQTSPTNNPKPVWNWVSGGLGGSGNYRFKLDDTTLSTNAATASVLTFSPDTALKAGLHTFYIQERDTAGNWSTMSSLALTIDLTPPNKPIVSGFVYHTLDASPSWHWTSGGGGSGAYRFKVDDSTMTAGTTTTTDTSTSPSTPLSIGATHTMFVQEKDAAGNWSPIGYFQIRVHGQTGFAYSPAGMILRTMNGGAKWDTITFSGGQGVYDMHFPSPQIGYAVGYQGTVLKTANGGTSWSSIATGLDNFLFTTWFTSTTTGYAAGEYGKILKTNNSGSTWQELPSKATGFIYGMQFIDNNTGYVSAEDGIFRTTNGGTSWDAVPTGYTDNFYSVHFIDLNNGFVGGGSGFIYATKDAGKTWTKTATGSSDALDEILFTDAKIGYATVYKTYSRTTDGGKTWNAYLGSKDLYFATFVDNTTGYARTTDGDVAKATDAFLSWDIVSTGSVSGSWKFYFP